MNAKSQPAIVKRLKKRGQALLRTTKGVKVSRLPKQRYRKSEPDEKIHEAPGED